MEPPEWLQQQTRQQQAAAPYCGLGFELRTLEPDLYALLRDKLAESAGSFTPETQIDEIGTTDPGRFASLHFEDNAFNALLSERLKPQHESW